MGRALPTVLLVALLGLVGFSLGCDSTPLVPDPAPTPLKGALVFLEEGADGIVELATLDVETRQVTRTPMAQFDSLRLYNRMTPSRDLRRGVFSGNVGPDANVVVIANLDGSAPHQLATLGGIRLIDGFQWSPDHRRLLYLNAGTTAYVLDIGPDNVPIDELACLMCGGIPFAGDTLWTSNGANWGNDSDHLIMVSAANARSSSSQPSVRHLYLIDLRTRTVERQLTSKPLPPAYRYDVARGGRVVLAHTNMGLRVVTDSGETVRPLEFQSQYSYARFIPEVRWGSDGRHVVLMQDLAEIPPGFKYPLAVGVIDTEDDALTWVEYGNSLPEDLGSLPEPVLVIP